MTSRIVQNEGDRKRLVDLIFKQELPCTVTITKGKRRSVEQNRLQRLWVKEIAEQSEGETAEEIRGFCKLTIGVPILRHENESFRQQYDSIVRPLPYEQKLAIMMEPLDMPVTRIMTVKQKTQYLDGIYRRFAQQGLTLTQPPDDMVGIRT